MLLSAAMQLKRQGKEPRTLRLYGQERNLITSAIARMNLFLHGFEIFASSAGHAGRSETAGRDSLRRFDLVLANPPYSIKQWNRKAWETDATAATSWRAAQGRADYASSSTSWPACSPRPALCDSVPARRTVP